jgi:hypothetical protein
VSAIWQSVDGAVAFALFLLCVANLVVGYSTPRWVRTTITAAILVLSVLLAASVRA